MDLLNVSDAKHASLPCNRALSAAVVGSRKGLYRAAAAAGTNRRGIAFVVPGAGYGGNIPVRQQSTAVAWSH